APRTAPRLPHRRREAGHEAIPAQLLLRRARTGMPASPKRIAERIRHMPTPKVCSKARTKRLRIPTDEEMDRMALLWSYAHARRLGAKCGLDDMILPREFRVPRATQEKPRSNAAIEASILRKVKAFIAERGRTKTPSAPEPERRL